VTNTRRVYKIKDFIYSMEFIDKSTIRLDKVINELDRFVVKFTKILEKHTDYVIVSGYVSILFGRSRSTEDVDVFIKEVNKEKFNLLCSDLIENGFWCLNTSNVDEMYKYLMDDLAIRFALKNETIPNFEVKVAKDRLAKETFSDRITVITKLSEVYVSSLEKQIAFKKYYLKSDKDLEDAKHIEEVFGEKIDFKKIDDYKRLIENEKT